MPKKQRNHSTKPKRQQRSAPTTVDNNLQLIKSPFAFTPKQIDVIRSIESAYEHLTILGYAGTAKTTTALYGALLELERGNYNHITLVRSAVQSRDIGHLPGDAKEKGEVYEKPFITIINNLYGRDDAYGILKKKGLLKFELTSFLRGETFENSVVIVDESQNMEASELSTVVTRLGNNSKMIICGDILQRDLKGYKEKTVEKVFDILDSMGSFTSYHMGIDDIVRSTLVKEFIIKSTELYPEGL